MCLVLVSAGGEFAVMLARDIHNREKEKNIFLLHLGRCGDTNT